MAIAVMTANARSTSQVTSSWTLITRTVTETKVNRVSPKALVSIVQVSSLKLLQLRTGIDVLKVPSGHDPIPTMPWEVVALDWIVLANLKGLQALEIGRLISGESHKLAQRVTILDL